MLLAQISSSTNLDIFHVQAHQRIVSRAAPQLTTLSASLVMKQGLPLPQPRQPAKVLQRQKEKQRRAPMVAPLCQLRAPRQLSAALPRPRPILVRKSGRSKTLGELPGVTKVILDSREWMLAPRQCPTVFAT